MGEPPFSGLVPGATGDERLMVVALGAGSPQPVLMAGLWSQALGVGGRGEGVST